VLRQARLEITLDKLIALARTTRRNGGTAADDPAVRDRIAQLYVENAALRLGNLRALAVAAERGEPGPEGSIGKLHWSELDPSPRG
jgi:alkylation response protein AidB-like acyl-CoA dehydrogenase